eukprot:jgi/Mesvir1/28056/Mv04656-RA.1
MGRLFLTDSPVPSALSTVRVCEAAVQSHDDNCAELELEETILFGDNYAEVSREERHASMSKSSAGLSQLAAKRATLISLVATEDPFCEKLRGDVEAFLLANVGQVDVKSLATELWKRGNYCVCLCETVGSCFCLGSHSHSFLEVWRSQGGSHSDKIVIVEPNLRQELLIARPSIEYAALLDCLPDVFVGSKDKLLKIVNFMAAAMAASFEMSGMSTAPWRNRRALLSNWFPVPCECGQSQSKGKSKVEKRCQKYVLGWQ